VCDAPEARQTARKNAAAADSALVVLMVVIAKSNTQLCVLCVLCVVHANAAAAAGKQRRIESSRSFGLSETVRGFYDR
jgi:hypothetical protein